MNSAKTVGKQTRCIAAFAAVVATILTMGGTLSLADRYADAGTTESNSLAGNPSPYQTAPTVNKQVQNEREAVDLSKMG